MRVHMYCENVYVVKIRIVRISTSKNTYLKAPKYVLKDLKVKVTFSLVCTIPDFFIPRGFFDIDHCYLVNQVKLKKLEMTD